MRKKRLGSYKNPSVSFKHFDDFIAPCIKLGVFLLQLRMGKDVILFGILSRYHLHFTNE
jgi:hypothetical protein